MSSEKVTVTNTNVIFVTALAIEHKLIFDLSQAAQTLLYEGLLQLIT